MNFKQFTEIVNTTEINEIYNAINEFKVNDSEIDNWIDDVFEHANEIDINKMPYILDSLYRSDDKFMFMSFCMLFEVTFQDLPFITRLEDIPIHKEKYKIFIETLLIAFEKSYDGVLDCLSAIILNNDPKGELLSKEQYDLLVNSINTKLALLKKYVLEAEHVEEHVYSTLEMIFDLAVYINNEDTIELLKRYERVPLNNKARAFYIKAIIQNNK
ncbi:MAG: hypothetical protein IJH12_03100 [Clostridia bacterium]|nr:hypothetical protein [Clostridia bacterium]